ncbi:hypothetical protein ACQJBY_059327 [Aegilops geniculata]
MAETKKEKEPPTRDQLTNSVEVVTAWLAGVARKGGAVVGCDGWWMSARGSASCGVDADLKAVKPVEVKLIATLAARAIIEHQAFKHGR